MEAPYDLESSSQRGGLLNWVFVIKNNRGCPEERPYLEVYREGTEPDEAAGPRGPAPPQFPSCLARRRREARAGRKKRGETREEVELNRGMEKRKGEWAGLEEQGIGQDGGGAGMGGAGAWL